LNTDKSFCVVVNATGTVTNANLSSGSLPTAANLKTGQRIFIESVHVAAAGAGVVSLLDGSGGTVVFMAQFAAAGNDAHADAFIPLTLGNGLYWSNTYAGVVNLVVCGSIQGTA